VRGVTSFSEINQERTLKKLSEKAAGTLAADLQDVWLCVQTHIEEIAEALNRL
jgi:hypothetical protein